ncbi:ubiquinone anaerobic biosynthesis accessory factor UbiT [Devosia faecipullorum]|uniref:ubiquinone anaerobic biosynthesis accessory factor UbiT n=1 Tax=Devosia faecipullorum TaxID=2755039 RepID=UPI00187B4071|nr:SCP2 sterol-binding domain-containing protein [Devosia faecipullorum]MBE7733555.1 SCP2 sterol-binding domain-containing protein [Devosia faecipullorum]
MPLPRALAALIDRTPLPVAQKATDLIFARALQQHPGLFDRLGEHAGKAFGFRPTDLDLYFVVHPSAAMIRLYRPRQAPPVAASISGPLVTLLALLEGQIDGDALFFSRSVTVTGDMEAILALRNGLDDCGFDLPRDLSGLAGPLALPFRLIAEKVRARALAGLA